MNIFPMWKFEKLEKTPDDSVMTLTRFPGIIGRILGKKKKRFKFIGGCTVWHRLPSYTREGVFMEGMLAEFWEEHKNSAS